jgi:hypothetical protein
MDTERSISTLIDTDGGICARSTGNLARMPSTTATVLASGCFWMPSTIERSSFSQVAIRSFSTLS